MPRFDLALASCALLLLAVGCGDNSPDPDPDAVAAAKCGLPVSQRFLTAEGERIMTADMHVLKLSGGRREVTGHVTRMSAEGGQDSSPPRTFTCVVAPDAADVLRGLRLESLEIEGSLEVWKSVAPEVVVRTYVAAVSVGDLQLARSLASAGHVRTVEQAEDSWYRNVVWISDLELGAARSEASGVFVPVTFTLKQRRAMSLADGSLVWGYRLAKTEGRWLIVDEGPV